MNATAKKITTTGEPVEEQAPQAPAEIVTPTTEQAPATLPAGYLSDGYHATADNGKVYLRPAYVSEYALEIAAALAMKPSDFAALMREMKRNRSRSLPFEARQTAAAEMLPKALALVKRKKAPGLLVDFIKANAAAVKNDEDWTAFYRHLEAINGYLTIQEGTDA